MPPRVLGDENEKLPPPTLADVEDLAARVSAADLKDRRTRKALSGEVNCLAEGSVFQGFTTDRLDRLYRTFPEGHPEAAWGWVGASDWDDVLESIDCALRLFPAADAPGVLRECAGRVAGCGDGAAEVPRALVLDWLARRVAAMAGKDSAKHF